MTALKGIDISTWQTSKFNFDSIKDLDFIIIRAGFTGTADGVNLNIDNCFEINYEKAKRYGIPVGCYWYSCANTAAKGQAEAAYLYEHCLKGKQFEYPIYLDVECDQYQTGKNKGVTDAILAWADYLEAKGYYVGVYANYNYFINHLENDRLNRINRWLAYWTENKPQLKFDYSMWQNTSGLIINNMKVDGDFAYKDFEKIIKDAGLNGFTKSDSSPKILTIAVGDVFQVKDITDAGIVLEHLDK